MATETYTKNYGTVNCYSTYTWETAASGRKWSNSGTTTGWNNFTANLTMIPEDATIISASYNSNYTQTYSGDGGQWISRGEGDLYQVANSANLKNYLIAGNRSVRLVYSFKGAVVSGLQDTASPTSASRTYKNITISVSYEVGGKTWLLHYGIGGEWVEVQARGGKDREWKEVEAYYGTNGNWQLCERIDVEE